jgi:hypothetical protein
MVGVLAPTIDEARGVQSAAGAQVDNTIGDALVGIARGLDSAFSGRGGGSSPTQTDRDREALRPFVERALEIQKRREAGMAPAEAEARQRRNFNEALSVLPDKADLVRSTIGNITGEVFAEPAKDLPTEERNALIGILTDPANPVGQAIFAESYSVDSVGNFDPEATVLKARERWFNWNARLARVEQLKLLKEEADLGSQVVQLNQQAGVEQFMAEATADAQAAVEGLIKAFPSVLETGGTPLTRETLVTELTALKAQYRNRSLQLATEAGILDNIQKTFTGGLDTVTLPIDNVIAFINRLTEQDVKVFEGLDAQSKVILLQALQGAGIAATGDVLKSEFFANTFLGAVRSDVSRVIQDVQKNFEAFQTTPVDETLGADAVDDNGDPTPELSSFTNGLSNKEAVAQVRASVAQFKALDSVAEMTPESLRVGVNEFVIAAETMNNRGAAIAEDTFDQIYDSRFFNVFNLVDITGGPEVTALENAVVGNLTKILVQRKLAAEVAIRSVGVNFPSLSIVFDGDKFTTEFSGEPKTDNESRLQRLLKAESLPVSMEGIRQFAKRDRARAIDLGLVPLLNEIDDQFRFLNKVVGVAGKFSDEMKEKILPSNKLQSVPQIASTEEWSSLEEGAEYEVQYEDGTVRRFIKGEE